MRTAGPLDPVLPRVPDCYRHGGQAFLRQFLPLLLMGFGVGLAVLLLGAIEDVPAIGGALALLFATLVVTPFAWSFFGVCLRAVRGQRAEAVDLLRVVDHYPQIVIAGFVCGLVVCVGLILLVVPGVIAYCRLKFVPFLILDAGLDAGDALRESVRLTRGHTAAIFGITCVGWGLSIAGLLAGGIGIVPASIWWDTAIASFYDAVVETVDAAEPEMAFA